MLDRVEHRGETFVILRKGRRVARISPASGANGKAARELLRRLLPDRAWEEELRELRASLTVQERRWSD
jgi:antitoxin (DNA-binding transcriptional repressor) of toxin-antitoxin stability system